MIFFKEENRLTKNETIIALFLTGSTTGQLGKQFLMSRQGIYNILKQVGLSGKDGGRAFKLANQIPTKKESLRLDKLNASCQNRYGCTYREWQLLRNMAAESKLTPITAYSHNRSYAARMDIFWDLSLRDWWAAWEISGRWAQRGRGDSDYCLARMDPDVGYIASNIEIIKNHDHWLKLVSGRQKKRLS